LVAEFILPFCFLHNQESLSQLLESFQTYELGLSKSPLLSWNRRGTISGRYSIPRGTRSSS